MLVLYKTAMRSKQQTACFRHLHDAKGKYITLRQGA